MLKFPDGVGGRLLKEKSFVVLAACFGFIIGTVAHSFLNYKFGFFWLYNLLLLAAATAIIFWKEKKTRLIFLGVFFILAGFARFDISIKNTDFLSNFWNKETLVEGIIIEEPINRIDKQQLVILPKEIGGQPVFGNEKILLTANLYPKYQYGDGLRFFCELQKPKQIEDFNYEKYLSIKDIYGLCYYPEVTVIPAQAGISGSRIKSGMTIWGTGMSRLLTFKNFLISKINSSLHEPLASFAAGLALGAKSSMPPALAENFNRTGTAHIIAISGWNITLLGRMFLPVLFIFGLRRGRAFYAMAIIVFAYAVMAGLGPSVLRAAVMGIIALWAQKSSRLNSAGRALLYSAVIMFAVNPRIIFDAGFWLSVSATFGLIYFSPIMENYLKNFKYKNAREGLSATLSAVIYTLPITSFIFGRITIWSLAANIFIMPFIAVATILSLGTSFLTALIPNQLAGSILFLPDAAVLKFIIFIINFFANIPFGYFDLKISFILMLAFYGIILAATFYKLTRIESS